MQPRTLADPSRERGRVRWFKPTKGHGRITSDSGDVLFVHFSHIRAQAFRQLEAGQRVEFVRVPQPGGDAAWDVVVLPEAVGPEAPDGQV